MAMELQHKPGARGVRRRAAILGAAEALFAERGFDATRLEAERVGVRRASLVYYFRDKRALYDAVLEELVGALYCEVERELSSAAPLDERVQAAVSSFVDFIAGRPSFARILLREIADGSRHDPPRLVRHTAALHALIARVQGESRSVGPRFPKADPAQIASTIVGTTVFFIAALPTLAPALDFDPLAPEQIESLKAYVRACAEPLLGAPEGVFS
jgi:TetR/AcrR family transcriptional regulator